MMYYKPVRIRFEPKELGRSDVLRGNAKHKDNLIIPLDLPMIMITKGDGEPNATRSINLIAIDLNVFVRMKRIICNRWAPRIADGGANEPKLGFCPRIKRLRRLLVMNIIIKIVEALISDEMLALHSESMLENLFIGYQVPPEHLAKDIVLFLTASVLNAV